MPASVQPVHDEPPELTDDMTRRDLVDVLEHLPLGRRADATCLCRVDRGVRDYLLRLLRGH